MAMLTRGTLVLAGLVASLGVACRVEAATSCPPPTPVANARWAGEAEWLAIQRAGLRYGAIRVQVDNVYDLADPREREWYTRAVDFLHIRTRKWVIDHLLVIRSGEPADARQIYEATRRLRTQAFLRAADIVPSACTDRTVDVMVHVRDAWTLNPDLRYARAGGATQWRFELDDDNFLGTGTKLKIGHQQTLDRSFNELEFEAPTLGHTDWSAIADYQNLSDGKLGSLTLTKPFVLDTTPWASSLTLLDQRLDLGFYDDGVEAWRLPQRERLFQGNWQALLRFDGDTAIRGGVAVDYERYSYGAPIAVNPQVLPPPAARARTLAGIGPLVSLHQDRYASFENLVEIGRVEDYNLGWDASAQVLYDSSALGASANGPDVSLAASRAFEPARDWLLRTGASWSARRDGGAWRNEALAADATAYGRPWRAQTLVFHVDYDALLHPDPENRLYIGGFQALRGYPNFFATGSRRVRVTLADRIVTRHVWFHTFQVGFVAFNDNARIDAPGGRGWTPWYSSVGGGLRFGNLRGSFKQVLYFVVAEPLRSAPGVRRGAEVVAGNVVSF